MTQFWQGFFVAYLVTVAVMFFDGLRDAEGMRETGGPCWLLALLTASLLWPGAFIGRRGQ